MDSAQIWRVAWAWVCFFLVSAHSTSSFVPAHEGMALRGDRLKASREAFLTSSGPEGYLSPTLASSPLLLHTSHHRQNYRKAPPLSWTRSFAAGEAFGLVLGALCGAREGRCLSVVWNLWLGCAKPIAKDNSSVVATPPSRTLHQQVSYRG
jgi:hypothetical protein